VKLFQRTIGARARIRHGDYATVVVLREKKKSKQNSRFRTFKKRSTIGAYSKNVYNLVFKVLAKYAAATFSGACNGETFDDLRNWN
jgi:hypothetical protein